MSAYNYRRIQKPTKQINCYEVPGKDWQRVTAPGTLFKTSRTVQGSSINLNEIHRRIDLFRTGEDIAKEHAKLVQDINSLRQVVFVSPWIDDSKDYDDAIYQEVIETSSTTTVKPSTLTSAKVTKPSGGIPVYLLGGSSQRLPVSVGSTKLPRPTISLIGSSATPQLTKHPYPFVGLAANTLQRPSKLCMAPPMPVMYSTTRRPTLWERFVSFFPRLQR